MQIQTAEGAIYEIEGDLERIFKAIRASDSLSSDEEIYLLALDLKYA